MRMQTSVGLALFTSLLLAGCGNLTAASNVSAPLGIPNVQHLSNQNLYVANRSTVTVYAANSDSPLRTISGLSPSTMILDGTGNLYVANVPPSGGGNVTEYRAGTSSILRTITTDLVQPHALALSPLGDLYVANSYFRVERYAPGATQPSGVLKVFYPSTLLTDRSADAYVASIPSPYGHGLSKVTQFSSTGTLLRTIVKGLDTPLALALTKTGGLFVANYGGNDVTVYGAGHRYVYRTISQGIKTPYALAFDSSGNLYVANTSRNTVSEYAPGGSSVMRTIKQGVARPIALCFDSAGDLFVANANSVREYPPGASSPQRTITKGIASPIALGFGP